MHWVVAHVHVVIYPPTIVSLFEMLFSQPPSTQTFAGALLMHTTPFILVHATVTVVTLACRTGHVPASSIFHDWYAARRTLANAFHSIPVSTRWQQV
jgi:hypothetical protein